MPSPAPVRRPPTETAAGGGKQQSESASMDRPTGTRRRLTVAVAGRRLVLRLLVLAVAWGRARGSWTCQGSCPDKDVQKLSFGGNVTITVIRAINLPNKDHFGPFSGTSDPYVEFKLGVTSGRSSVVSNDLNPWWGAPGGQGEDVALGLHRSKTSLDVKVWDSDSGLELGRDLLGSRSLSLPFCSMFSAPTLTEHCGDDESMWEHCSAYGSAWHYPVRQKCNETGWLVLDGSKDDSVCSASSSKPCLLVRISIVPFQVSIEAQYASGTLSTSVAGYTGGIGYPWANNFGYLFADQTYRWDSSYTYATPVTGGVLVRTHTSDRNLDEARIYMALAINFDAHVWVCRALADFDSVPAWLDESEGWEPTNYRVTYTNGLLTWRCHRKRFAAVGKNQFDYLTDPPIYLYGNQPAAAKTLMKYQYVVVVVPEMDDDDVVVAKAWSTAFTRKAFWRLFFEFGLLLSLFASLAWRYLGSIKLRIDRIEADLVKHGGSATALDSHVLASVFLCYNESKANVEFRRALYFSGLAVRFLLLVPFVLLWCWGIVAIHAVNPPAVGWGLLLLGTMLMLGTYGFSLWRAMGWCMTGLAQTALGLASLLGVVFIVVVVFTSPAVVVGHEPLDFLSLSVVFGTLNLVPLIFRAFTSDKSLSRSVNQLLSTAGMAAKAITGDKGGRGIQVHVASKTTALAKPGAATAKVAPPSTANARAMGSAASPFNTLLQPCYSIHGSIPYFKYADMVAVILQRCTGQISRMSRSLYVSSVVVLLVYAVIASVQTRYPVLAWSNALTLLFLDLLHYLLGRGSKAWAPGHDVAILSAGRMLLTVLCGDYWLLGYSFTYMVYGYALTAAVINKYLPHLTKAEAGAVAFFGQELGRPDFDMAASPEFCFGLLSFAYLFLLLVCAYTRPSGFPLPSIPVGGMAWPVYVFGVAAFLFILITCLTRATFRAAYLSRENLLMGSFRDAFFWTASVRLPIVLAVFTLVLVVCSGLLIWAATKASLVFTLSVFLPPIVGCLAYSYHAWAANDYHLLHWPPGPEAVREEVDPEADDTDLAYGMIGSLFGLPSSSSSTGQGGPASGGPLGSGGPPSAFNFNKLADATPALTNGPRPSAPGGSDKQKQLFELPPLVKTGKEALGEIKMPALPLKANLKRKELKDDAVLQDALAGLEVSTPLPNQGAKQLLLAYPTGAEAETKQDPSAALIEAARKSKEAKRHKTSRKPRFREWVLKRPCVQRVAAVASRMCCFRRSRKFKIAQRVAAMEAGELLPEEEGPDLSKIPLWRAIAEGWLLDEEYKALAAFCGLVGLIVLMGLVIASANKPHWMGHLIWSMGLSLLFTVIPIIKWFNSYDMDNTIVWSGGLALLLFWLSLTVFFVVSLKADVNDPGSLWVLTAMVYYPAIVLAVVRFLAWRDDDYRVVALDQDGDGDISVGEVCKWVNVTPLFLGLAVVFTWEMSLFGSRTIGVLLALALVLALLGLLFARDWARNDFYLSAGYQRAGNLLLSTGMAVSLLVGLLLDVSLLLCLSMFFFLAILKHVAALLARRFVMEPDVPLYISPYVFPLYSYSSRSNDLVDETEALGLPLYAALLLAVGWGMTFAIFVTPQSLGVAIACIFVIITVVVTAILIEQVPLALGSSSRFLDSSTILEAADVAKRTFTQRRRPIQFECAEWAQDDEQEEQRVAGGGRGGKWGGANKATGNNKDQQSTQQQPVEEERRSAAELAKDVSAKLQSLRKSKGRRHEDKLHSEALYSTADALAEAFLTGNGPLGCLGLAGRLVQRCCTPLAGRPCCCCLGCLHTLKQYGEDGQRLNVEKLGSKKLDSQAVLLKLPGLDDALSCEFHEELRCVIHLWVLLIVAADGRLRREKVLFQKFLRENRFKLLSNGIAPPKNIFSSASFASINIRLVAVWLSTLTPEERERFHLLKAKFSEEQAARDALLDQHLAQAQAEERALLARRAAREDDMCRRRYKELLARREARMSKWVATLPQEQQRAFLSKYKAVWMKNQVAKVPPEDEDLYKAFLQAVTLQGGQGQGDEALACAREALQELEAAERSCKPGQFGRSFQFHDPDFPQGPSSLGPNCGVDLQAEPLGWAVSLQFNANAVLFDAGTDPDDVFKGRLGDGWLLSAISMLAAAGGVGDGGVDEQVQQLFVGFVGEDGKMAFQTSVGAYGVRLFKNGQWETVIVDDFFPLLKDKEDDPATRGAAFAYTKEMKELWVPLIEKAFAKYYGSYSELQQGYVHHALKDLTGCQAEEVPLARASRGVGKRSLWDLMRRAKKSGYILGAGSVSSQLADRQILDTGLVFGAAYTIYDVREVDEHLLIKLRNPPGDHDEWKGDWGDRSPLWTKRYRKKLGQGGSSGGEDGEEDDNTFWMSLDDFCLAFQSLYVCKWANPHTWKTSVLRGAWRVGSGGQDPFATSTMHHGGKAEEVDTSAGLPSKHNRACSLDRNPQWEVVVQRRTELRVSLSQTDASGLATPHVHPVALYVLNMEGGGAVGGPPRKGAAAAGGGKKRRRGTLVTAITSDNLYASTGPPVREREQTIYCTLEPGVYVLLAATYLPGMEGPFSITLVSNFSLMDVTQLWPPVWRAQTGLGSTLAAAAMTLAEKAVAKATDAIAEVGDDPEEPDPEAATDSSKKPTAEAAVAAGKGAALV